jgi:hypothetical protein
MKLIKIIRTPKAEVLLTREDVRLIEACTKLHYDAEVMRGLLNKLKIYVEVADPSRVVFEFCDLDLSAKMLEKSLSLPDKEDRQKAYALHNQIRDLLRNLNRQYEADNEVAAKGRVLESAEERDRTTGGEVVPFPHSPLEVFALEELDREDAPVDSCWDEEEEEEDCDD